MGIFVSDSYMDNYFSHPNEEYMIESLKDRVANVLSDMKEFAKKIIQMIKDFIFSIVNKVKMVFVKHDIKRKIKELKKIPSFKFSKRKVDVPDVKGFKKAMSDMEKTADKALDALASRNPFYIRSYESGEDDIVVKTRSIEEREFIHKYLDSDCEKDIDSMNDDVEKSTQRVLNKAESVAKKNPNVAGEARGIVTKITNHFKRHALKYVGAALATAALIKGFSYINDPDRRVERYLRDNEEFIRKSAEKIEDSEHRKLYEDFSKALRDTNYLRMTGAPKEEIDRMNDNAIEKATLFMTYST